MEKDFEEHLARLRRRAEEAPRCPQEIERNPDWFQRKAEREGRSNWSGGSFGGGTWAGRARSDGERHE